MASRPASLLQVESPDEAVLDGLIFLLQDAVRQGASIGFLPPLPNEEAAEFWRGCLEDLGPNRALWVAKVDGRIAGTVQYSRCSKANGRHRAEVQKLLVAQEHQGCGLARMLMEAAEAHARANGVELLVLDTESGSPAEFIYVKLGWTRAGSIPEFACAADGSRHSTTYLYKLLR